MLILSRMIGESVIIEQSPNRWLVTLSALSAAGGTLEVTVAKDIKAVTPAEAKTIGCNEAVELAEDISVRLVDMRGEKAYIGIDAPRTSSVYRLEMFEAIHRAGEDGLSDTTGAAVPRPRPPQPPSLRVELEEPKAGEQYHE